MVSQQGLATPTRELETFSLHLVFLPGVKQRLPLLVLKMVLEEKQTRIPAPAIHNQGLFSLFTLEAGQCGSMREIQPAGLEEVCVQQVAYSRQALGLRAGALPAWYGGLRCCVAPRT